MAEWLDEELKILRCEHAKGMSCADISKVLKKAGFDRTRNSVLGKAHRLGLQPSANKGRPANKPDPRVTLSRTKIAAPLPPLPPSEPYTGDGVRLIDHKEGKCRWPINGWGADLIYCGRDAGGQSYCEAHSRVAYDGKVRKKRKQQKLLRHGPEA